MGEFKLKAHSDDDYVWGYRLGESSHYGHYIDDFIFETDHESDEECTINAKSRRQSLSWNDEFSNHCNMYNILMKLN